MIHWLLPTLMERWEWPAMLQYIGARAGLAFAFAFFIAILLGRPLIRRLRAVGVGEDAGNSDDAEIGRIYQAAGKGGTPTMGGVFWTTSILASVLLFGALDEPLLLLGAALLVGMGTIGFLDDWVKWKREGGRNGLSRGTKLGLSALLAGWVVTMYWFLGDPSTGVEGIRRIYFPLLTSMFAEPEQLGWWGFVIFLGFETLVILSCCHAANVTDGLDGLAAGSALPPLVALSAAVWAISQVRWADFLGLPFIPGAGEVAVLGGAVLGATLGFLWFNGHPAQVFFGDSGSLPLGAVIAYFAIVSKLEFALPLLAGVFVLEVSTSLLQIYYFKFTGGKRLFLKAPIHHVWQIKGVPEQRIVLRFWIGGCISAALGLLLIKASL